MTAAAKHSLELDGLAWNDNGQSVMSGCVLELFQSLDRAFLSLAAAWGATEYRFPTFVSARQLHRLDYFRSFPHLATFPVCLDDEDANLGDFVDGPVIDDHGHLKLTRQRPIEDVLTPAACYHLYIHLQDTESSGCRYLTTRNTCFRREEYYRPLERQWSFSMREIVAIGTLDEVGNFLQSTQAMVNRLLADHRPPRGVGGRQRPVLPPIAERQVRGPAGEPDQAGGCLRWSPGHRVREPAPGPFRENLRYPPIGRLRLHRLRGLRSGTLGIRRRQSVRPRSGRLAGPRRRFRRDLRVGQFMNTVLVTGGDGYLGRQVAERYLAGSDADVIVAVRATEPRDLAAKSAGLADLGRRVTVIPGDVTGVDPFATVDTRSITSVVHSAAVTRFNVAEDDARRVNLDGTAKVLAFASRCPNLERISILSTLYSTGLTSGPVAEVASAGVGEFANFYEWSKHECERLVLDRFDSLPWQLLRVATVISHDQSGIVRQFNAFHNTLKLYFYGMLSLLPGSPTTPLYFIDGQFAADAIFSVATSKDGGVFHISHPLRLGPDATGVDRSGVRPLRARRELSSPPGTATGVRRPRRLRHLLRRRGCLCQLGGHSGGRQRHPVRPPAVRAQGDQYRSSERGARECDAASRHRPGQDHL